MGILQGVIVFLQKSAGKIVRAIFGWSVNALFATVSAGEKTALSILVGAAAVWPLLLLGIPFPKFAALILAFVPIPKRVAPGWIRAFWIAAAAIVPVAVGIGLARRGRARRSQPAWKTWLSGFPVTLAISAAFLTAFITAPIRRLIAMARRREELTIPLLVERPDYNAAAQSVRAILESGGLAVSRTRPPFLLTAPSRVLRALGGKTLKDEIPEEFHFYRRPDLEVIVVPSGVTLRAEKSIAARAHALICEEATFGPGLQTSQSDAQDLEKRIKDVWVVFARQPEAHRGSLVLRGSVDEISREFGHTNLDFDDWQILYREIAQVSRAIEGEAPLLKKQREGAMKKKEHDEDPETRSEPRGPTPQRRMPGRPMQSLPTSQLVAGLTSELRELVGKEIHLAKAELRIDLKAELKSARWFGLALCLALGFVNMLFVAAALWLARWLTPPLAALAVAGFLLLIAAALAWLGKSAFKMPLETTRKTLRESLSWAKRRAA